MTTKHILSMTTLEDSVAGSIDTVTVMGYVDSHNRKQFVFDHLKEIVSGPITKEALMLGMRVFQQYAKDEGMPVSHQNNVSNRSRFINPNLFH